MPFQKGRKKTGGKVKGCKHKINRDIVGLLDSLNCNPIEGLARIATDTKVEIGVRVAAFRSIARYVHPELKSIELSGPGGAPIQHEHSNAAEELISRMGSISATGSTQSSDSEHESDETARIAS